MVLADSFCQNAKARSSEFATTINDTPLIVQFAANNVNDYVDATRLIYPYADGVDLNCGCPQHWAMKDGYGCSLLTKPNVIYDLVRGIRNNLPNSFSVSVKIRILKDIKETVEMCQQLEKCGVSFLSVHGRTPLQKSGDAVNTAALSDVVKSVQIPIIANGGIKSLEEANKLVQAVSCAGVMAASGILSNPAMFSGADRTPWSVIKMWMDLKNRGSDRITFQIYHHHLVFMLEKVLSKQQKLIFNHLSSFEDVDQYLSEFIESIDNVPVLQNDELIVCEFDDKITSRHSAKCRGCSKSLYYCICSDKYDCNTVDGSFFTAKVRQSDCELDFMDSNLFVE